MQEAYAMTENFAYSPLTRLGQPRLGSVGKACPLRCANSVMTVKFW